MKLFVGSVWILGLIMVWIGCKHIVYKSTGLEGLTGFIIPFAIYLPIAYLLCRGADSITKDIKP